MIKKLFAQAVNSGWALAVGAMGATIGNAIYEVGSYVLHETILKEEEEDEKREKVTTAIEGGSKNE